LTNIGGEKKKSKETLSATTSKVQITKWCWRPNYRTISDPNQRNKNKLIPFYFKMHPPNSSDKKNYSV